MIKKLGNYAFFSAQQDVHPDVLLLCTNKAHPSQTKMHGEGENFPSHRYDVKKKLEETTQAVRTASPVGRSQRAPSRARLRRAAAPLKKERAEIGQRTQRK